MSEVARVFAAGEGGKSESVEGTGVKMKITTRAVYDIETGRLLERDSFDYEGPLELAGGGPSQSQKDAAAAQADATRQASETQRQMLDVYKGQLGKIEPFATSRLNNGLPFYNALTDFSKGTTAQAYQPAYAALNRRLTTMGALPSGFRTQALSDLDAARARAFDQNQVQNMMLNETAKNNAAAMLTGQQQLANPLGWTNATMQGNQSIMQAPLASPGIGGILGGIAGAALPF
jgi:hypothetical protein